MKKNEYDQNTVNGMFSSVADKYDIMNHIMSFGLQKGWKRRFAEHLPIPVPGQPNIALDVAAGSGDIASLIQGYKVVACDINMDMIKTGIEKTTDRDDEIKNIHWVQCSGECLPFKDDSFCCCTIAFGIRNIEDRVAALREFRRVLRPGGKFICMEFTRVDHHILRTLYAGYLNTFIPRIGEIVARDRETYAYLADSILRFPGSGEFANTMIDCGFKSVSFQKMSLGVVAIHSGFK